MIWFLFHFLIFFELILDSLRTFRIMSSTYLRSWVWKYSINSLWNNGLPRRFSGKESICQFRKHRFDPWSGKIPCVEDQLSPWATATEPGSCNYWSPLALEPWRSGRPRALSSHRNEKPGYSKKRGTSGEGLGRGICKMRGWSGQRRVRDAVSGNEK